MKLHELNPKAAKKELEKTQAATNKAEWAAHDSQQEQRAREQRLDMLTQLRCEVCWNHIDPAQVAWLDKTFKQNNAAPVCASCLTEWRKENGR